jgi:serine/threonine protein kinase
VKHSGWLRYCAPEAVANPSLQLIQQPPTTVSSAVDIWAIGVIAFELLTNTRVFSPAATDEEIMAALRGRSLPWEVGAEGHAECCEKLRGLKRAVLACLDREPSRRPTAASLLSSWEHIFDSMKTQGTFEPTTSVPGESVSVGVAEAMQPQI